MTWLKCIIFCSILFAYGDGFLSQTNPPTSQTGTPSTSQLQQELLYISDSLSKETVSRQQLEQIVFRMIQDMAKIKQQNTSGLLDDLMSLNKSVDHLNMENQALKHENANLTLEINILKQANNDVKQLAVALLLDNNNITQEMNHLKQEISVLKRQEKSLQLMASDIDELKLNEATCRRDVDSLIANITSSHAKGQDYGIGFTVSFNNDSSRSGIMTFDKIVSNYGYGYNATSGKFTCTKSGLYIFVLNILSNTRNADAWIIHNNSLMSRAYTSDEHNNTFNDGATSAVIQLNVGDEVWAKSDWSFYYDDDTYFSGALISAY